MSETKRPGRPAKSDDEKLQTLTTRVSPQRYEQLCREANERGLHLAQLVRQKLERDRETSV